MKTEYHLSKTNNYHKNSFTCPPIPPLSISPRLSFKNTFREESRYKFLFIFLKQTKNWNREHNVYNFRNYMKKTKTIIFRNHNRRAYVSLQTTTAVQQPKTLNTFPKKSATTLTSAKKHSLSAPSLQHTRHKNTIVVQPHKVP
jgi:hypothetical protein